MQLYFPTAMYMIGDLVGDGVGGFGELWIKLLQPNIYGLGSTVEDSETNPA